MSIASLLHSLSCLSSVLSENLAASAKFMDSLTSIHELSPEAPFLHEFVSDLDISDDSDGFLQRTFSDLISLALQISSMVEDQVVDATQLMRHFYPRELGEAQRTHQVSFSLTLNSFSAAQASKGKLRMHQELIAYKSLLSHVALLFSQVHQALAHLPHTVDLDQHDSTHDSNQKKAFKMLSACKRGTLREKIHRREQRFLKYYSAIKNMLSKNTSVLCEGHQQGSSSTVVHSTNGGRQKDSSLRKASSLEAIACN